MAKLIFPIVIIISIIVLYGATSYSHNKCKNESDYRKCMNI